jgi:NADPH-dependent 7-cyano-7-deazaguanine reductase QueF
MDLLTQPNESRCAAMIETHILPLEPACPMSGNPQAGSVLSIKYRPTALILEVASLRAYIDSYKGGRGDIRSMEGMIQAVTQDCANAARVDVTTIADLIINPNQRMVLECSASAQH